MIDEQHSSVPGLVWYSQFRPLLVLRSKGVLAQVPAAPLPIQLPGKAAAEGPSSRLLASAGPAPAIAAMWGVNQ